MTSEERKRALDVEKYVTGIIGIKLKDAVKTALIFDILCIAVMFTVSLSMGDQSYAAGILSPLFIMIVNFLIYGLTSAASIKTMYNFKIESSCSVNINDFLCVLPIKPKDVCNYSAICFEAISAVTALAMSLIHIAALITNNMGFNTFFNLIGLYLFISMIFRIVEYFCFVFKIKNGFWGAFIGGLFMAMFMFIPIGFLDGLGTVEEISEFNDRLHIFSAFSGISGIIIEIIFLAFLIFICEIRFKNKNSISWNLK